MDFAQPQEDEGMFTDKLADMRKQLDQHSTDGGNRWINSTVASRTMRPDGQLQDLHSQRQFSESCWLKKEGNLEAIKVSIRFFLLASLMCWQDSQTTKEQNCGIVISAASLWDTHHDLLFNIVSGVWIWHLVDVGCFCWNFTHNFTLAFQNSTTTRKPTRRPSPLLRDVGLPTNTLVSSEARTLSPLCRAVSHLIHAQRRNWEAQAVRLRKRTMAFVVVCFGESFLPSRLWPHPCPMPA